MSSKPIPLADRFWSKVDKDGPIPIHCHELGPCWVWTASLNQQGYGKIGAGGGGNGHRRAHRVSWELNVGPIPDEENVLHKCDNRPCVNPNHLFLGSKADNTHDMWAKGRHSGDKCGVRGEAHGRAKLTNENVATIREMANKGVKTSVIVEQFGMKNAQIRAIIRGAAWKTVGM